MLEIAPAVSFAFPVDACDQQTEQQAPERYRRPENEPVLRALVCEFRIFPGKQFVLRCELADLIFQRLVFVGQCWCREVINTTTGTNRCHERLDARHFGHASSAWFGK